MNKLNPWAEYLDRLGPDFIDPRARVGKPAGIFFNLSFLLLLLAMSFATLQSAEATTLVLGLGVIGAWRHSWGALNVFRALLHIKRSHSPEQLQTGLQLVVVATFYDQADRVVAEVVRGLNAGVAGLAKRPLVIIAYREERHRRIVETLFRAPVTLHFVRQVGLGKREALADALWKAKNVLPDPVRMGAATLLVDGDTIVTRDAIEESLHHLASRDEIGAVVVNEQPLVRGRDLFPIWRLLRSLQRNKVMSAFALSDRALVLTGRFAMIRGSILLQPEVINRIRKDYLVTRDAYIPLLTGDDKTTWLEVLRRGYGIAYLPNTYIGTIEDDDTDLGLFRKVYALTTRYSGNMARANLHRDAWLSARDKLHFKYGLLDQRISMWTGLLTPAVLLGLLIFGPIEIFIVFLTYVVLIKNIQAVAIGWINGTYDPYFPYLLFFDQVLQSLVKVRSFAFLHSQRWTNQNIEQVASGDNDVLDRQAARTLTRRLMFFGLFVGYLYVFLR